MFEIWPSTTSPGLKLVEDRLAHLLALVLEDGAAREHDVVARAVELDHLAAELLAEELVEVLDAADVDERRRQEAAHAEVEDQAALDDLDHLAVHRLAALGRLSIAFQAISKRARFFDRISRPSASSLVRTSASISSPSVDLVGRIDRAPDRELRDRDDALRLVADVDEDLVLVHADDLAVHDLALVDRREGRRRSRGSARRRGRSSRRRPRSCRLSRLSSEAGQYSQVFRKTPTGLRSPG